MRGRCPNVTFTSYLWKIR